MPSRSQELREKIRSLVAEYHAAAFPRAPFIPGQTPVPVSGRTFDATDIEHLVDASLDFWLTTGRFAARFRKEFANYFGIPHVMLTNSGSSANLLAVSALTSPLLGERRLRPGDEVITVALGFPTTINPIIQNELVPVFIDTTIPQYTVDVTALEAALSPRTRAMIFAHTLGNPFDLDAVMAFAKEHDLWLIEDCCDALGSTYRRKLVGTFGDLATFSFYPAHHITMGEGGAVITSDPLLQRIVTSFKNWGRDCWCVPGACNTCGKRFEWKLGDLPEGYDHKYIFTHIGYNLKLTDMQAAVGLAQLQKLSDFIARRKKTFTAYREGLQDLEEVLILPEATEGSDPSWFGFPIAVRPEAPFTRDSLVHDLEDRLIATRMLFCGNAMRQPAYERIHKRVIGDLHNADFVMNHVFWIGVFPGVTDAMIDYVLTTFHACTRKPQAIPLHR
jgi:CDP-6-deoxy-D-xylo-4-hexulose-3-dehydrase